MLTTIEKWQNSILVKSPEKNVFTNFCQLTINVKLESSCDYVTAGCALNDGPNKFSLQKFAPFSIL